MNIIIEKMTLDDLNSLKENFNKNFDKFWNYSILENDFKNNDSYYIVAKCNNEVLGFAGYLKILDEINILNIVTRIDKRNLHIGSRMLEYIIYSSKIIKADTVTLEVNINNIPAIKLYEKYNFEKVGIRKKYYNGIDDAIIMTLHIQI